MVEPLDLTFFERHELQGRASLLERVPGPGQLHLLNHVGREKRNLLPRQLISHLNPLSRCHKDAYPLTQRNNAANAGSAGVRSQPLYGRPEPREIIMAAQSAAGSRAGVRLGGFEPPTRGLEGRRSVH